MQEVIIEVSDPCHGCLVKDESICDLCELKPSFNERMNRVADNWEDEDEG